MGVGSIRIEASILHLIDHIHPVREKRILDSVEFVAYYQRFEFHTELVGEHTALGEKFKTHVGYLAMLILAIYYEIVVVVHDSKKLADSVVDDKLLDKILDLRVVVGKRAALLGGEHYVFNGLHLCGRTGETDL